MHLRVIGAGLPRTGTMSLKHAIEHLLGGPCYHMHELYQRPEHVGLWNRVIDGETDLLPVILQGYCAALDWPVSAVWRDAAELFTDAKVLLSLRAKPQDWWDSVDQTVWEIIRTGHFRFSDDPDEARAFSELHKRLTRQFSDRWDEQDAALAAYSDHLKSVRECIPKGRLIEFEVGDGWSPLCHALDASEPGIPFPNKNDRMAFKARNTI